MESSAGLRPRHLAILAYLAMSERPPSRDALVATFWGEEPEANARHSLSNALSAIRGVLGQSAISARRDSIELSPDVRLAIDAVEFIAACEAHDDVRAASLYRGGFLDDTPIIGAADFDTWAARVRSRLERAFIAVCERRVPSLLRASEWLQAAELSERWLRAAPRSVVAFTSVLRARSGPQTADALRAALADFARLRDWLAEDFGLRPDPVVRELVEELETRRAASEDAIAKSIATASAPVPATHGQEAPIDDAPIKHTPPARQPRRVTRWRVTIAATTAAVILLALWPWIRRPHVAAAATRTVVAITEIKNLRGDTALSWLEDGLPQLITDDLAAGGTVEPVSPIRVRDVLARRGDSRRSPLADRDAIDVARRLGATWTVRGGLTGGGGAYILDLDVRDVATGSEIESFTVMSDNPVKLGQLAAARLLDIATSKQANASDPPRFVGATANPEAYRHFVLGLRAASEGRYPDDSRELEAAIALDSGFVEAMSARRDLANMRGETAVFRRMDSLIALHADRLSEWSRLRGEMYRAMYSGEIERSEALAQRLVARYPRDPRAYTARAEVLAAHGRWLSADSVFMRELSLDSLAMEAGDGPCSPCAAYYGLVGVRLSRGDLAGAERAARRWVDLQPGIPGSWQALSIALEFEGHLDEAIEAGRRMVSLTNDPARIADLGRMFIIARQFAQVDSLIAVLRAAGGAERAGAVDLAVTMARERGQFHKAADLLAEQSFGLELIQADNLVRLGRVSEARRHYEASGHFEAPHSAEAFTAPQARAFTWAHALEADALWRVNDTSLVRALLDSVRLVGARSYYGRDWNLYHHLAGLLALSRADTNTAERELRSARWGIAGWTATPAMVARLRLAHGDGRGALAALHDASAAPLDAMGRYVTRTEIDYLTALAFARVGVLDSAGIYAARVRHTWRDADPEVRRLMATLPR